MTENSPKSTPTGNQDRRPLWRRILKWTLVTIAIVIVLITCLITVAVAWLKPERLTPLVTEQANKALDADIEVGHIELSFWSTFPHLEIDIRDVTVISRSLDRLPDSTKVKLPQWADSLALVKRFHGAVNIPELLIGRIALSDITIDRPAFNLVAVASAVSNYDIVAAPSPQPDETKDEPVAIPDFTFGTFAITGEMPVRYFSYPDSTCVSVKLTTTSLDGNNSPSYAIAIDGITSARISGMRISSLDFGVGGKIKWNHRHPLEIGLEGFNITIGKVATETTATIDLTNELTVNNLDFKLKPTAISDIIAVVPCGMRGELDKISGDLSLSATINLTSPYCPATDSIPSARVDVNIPKGTLTYDRLHLSTLQLDMNAVVNGREPDLSTVTINNLTAIGDGVGFSLDATVSTPFSDPSADGYFKGGISMSRLPVALTSRLPFTIKGELRADSRFSLRQSYLTPTNFHRIKLTGEATLSDFYLAMNDASAKVYTRKAQLNLGTENSFTRGNMKADSLLTAAFTIDTLSMYTPGVSIEGREWKAGIGCLNTASSSDTTVINPIGARISGKLLSMRSDEDSMRIRLRDISIGGSLRRFNGNKRLPQLHLDIYAGRAIYGDRWNRAALSKAFLGVTLHPAPPRIGRRMKARMDSISALHPELSPDSVYAEARRIARASRPRHKETADSAQFKGENVEIELDNSMKQLLRRWKARGLLKAERARVFTPYFPVRNTIKDLNLSFTTDSITITDTRYIMGKSDFLINGTIGNISKSLTSRRDEPLDIYFDVMSDTIDVNQLAAAVFAGAAFADRDSTATAGIVIPDTEDDASMQAAVENVADPDSTGALIIPMNIDALLNVTARNILYSDLVMHDFSGSLMVLDGAINLHGLRARTDIGSLDLSALYSAPSKDDMKFAFGLKINDFYIDRFTRLIPAVDSLMPLLNDISGIINADIAATSRLDEMMNINIPSLAAAIKISGDSLVLLDAETFKTVSKWLLFKDKKHNMIDSMNVEMVVRDSRLEMFPFMFNIDRYKLGVMGNNDMAMNFNYHVAVMKSPLPFRFGINLSGNPDKFKVRLGKAKFNEKSAGVSLAIADTTRINLVNRIENIFRRGVRNASITSLELGTAPGQMLNINDEVGDTISHADSLIFINEGLLPPPPAADSTAITTQKRKKK